MGFRVVFSQEALRQLRKLDKQMALLITGWVRKNLEGTDDPRAHGKPLTSNRAGQWRYRIGDYRLLAKIMDREIVILILAVGHRSLIYH